MGKVKIKKSDVWIDMTPMSDVMTLLLCFFMLTSTFVKVEPVKVNTPGSVTEAKVPASDVLNILINPEGKIFMSMDKTTDLVMTVEDMCSKFGFELNGQQMKNLREDGNIGVPLESFEQFLSLTKEQMAEQMKNFGVPTDSIDNGDGTKGMSEFQHWVKSARGANSSIKICIKADAETPYAVIKNVMSELQDMNENRYQLITSYKMVED